MLEKDRLDSLNEAKEAWLDIHVLVVGKLLPIIDLHVKELKKTEVKTACKANGAGTLQRSIVLAGALHRASHAAKDALTGAYALFNACHQIDVFIREAKDGVTIEDTMISLRGIAGDNTSSPLLSMVEVQTREMLAEGEKAVAAVKKQSLEALRPARKMTLQDLDDYRIWMLNERPDLIESAEELSPFDLLMPEAEA